MSPIEQPHVDPIPPPKGWARVWRFLFNWREIWLWTPLALFSIWVFAQFGYFLTGRRPTESVDWIVGIAGNLVKCVCVIVLLSVLRESSGVWLKKEELLANPTMAWIQMIGQSVTLIVMAYLISH